MPQVVRHSQMPEAWLPTSNVTCHVWIMSFFVNLIAFLISGPFVASSRHRSHSVRMPAPSNSCSYRCAAFTDASSLLLA
jgi:hypothetical protein